MRERINSIITGVGEVGYPQRNNKIINTSNTKIHSECMNYFKLLEENILGGFQPAVPPPREHLKMYRDVWGCYGDGNDTKVSCNVRVSPT